MSDKTISEELYTRMVESIAYKLADILYAMVNAEDGGMEAYGVWEEGILEKRQSAVELLEALGEDANVWVREVAKYPEELVPALDWNHEQFMEHVHGEGWEDEAIDDLFDGLRYDMMFSEDDEELLDDEDSPGTQEFPDPFNYEEESLMGKPDYMGEEPDISDPYYGDSQNGYDDE